MDIGSVSRSGVDFMLQQQLLALDRVAGRLAGAQAVLPSQGGEGVWSGDARRMYVHALQQLSTQVHAAATHVDEAIRDTRHALALLAGGSHSSGAYFGGPYFGGSFPGGSQAGGRHGW
jgi:hypothetical protein